MWFLIAVIGISPCDLAYGYAEYNQETITWAIKENKELVVRPTVEELVKDKSGKFKVLGKFSEDLFPKNGQLYIKTTSQITEVKMKSIEPECYECKRRFR